MEFLAKRADKLSLVDQELRYPKMQACSQSGSARFLRCQSSTRHLICIQEMEKAAADGAGRCSVIVPVALMRSSLGRTDESNAIDCRYSLKLSFEIVHDALERSKRDSWRILVL
jgi:hypothetical protein